MYTYSPTAILITGASSGLGKALALEYGRVGVVLWLTGRNEARLLKTVRAAEQQGATVFWKILDISDQEQVRDWIDEIEEQTPLDLVISNAGITGSHSIGDEIETANTAHAQVSTNLGGTINLVTAIAPYMQKRRSGRIALISSLAGMQPISDGPAYGASKAGIIAYVKRCGIICMNGMCLSQLFAPDTSALPWLISSKAGGRLNIPQSRQQTQFANP